jgi:putative DNA primase/helicase
MYTLGNGKTATAADQQQLVAAAITDKGKVELTAAARAIAQYFGEDLCFQGITADKGWWRYWSGTHWVEYDAGKFKQDIEWLFDGNLTSKQLVEVINHVATKLYVPHERFDQKPIVVFKNCVLEVRDKKIVPYAPKFVHEDFITQQVPITLAKQATPQWDAILRKVLPNPQDRIAMQELFGYVFFPSVQLQVFHVLLGEAGCGKSTILEILRDMLGADKVSAVPMANLHDSHALAGLADALLNIDSEAEYLDAKGEGVLKAITGGTPVNINQKYKPRYDKLLPTKFIFSCNELPRFADKSKAIWSRLVQIPFTQEITGTEQIEDIINWCRPEYGGILAWALDGLMKVLPKGTRAQAFTQSAVAIEQIEEHKLHSNPFLAWYEENIDEEPDAIVDREAAFNDYQFWCKCSGYKPVGKTGFYSQMQRKGVAAGKPHRGARYWKGISIRKVVSE